MKPLSYVRLAFPLASAIAALLALQSVQATNLYWDIDGATAGAGGATPSGTWSTGGTTWSTNSNGSVATPGVTTSLLDDLFFSAGANATGAYTITLNDTQDAKSLTFQEGTTTISGAGGVINLGGTGIIQVNNTLLSAPLSANIGNNTTTLIGGTAGLTKTGNGTLTLNGSAVHTFTGGLNVNGGILNLDFANLATPTDLINSGNALTIGGSGRLLITGKSTGTTSQTLGNVTVASGGGSILGNKNGGTATNIILGSLTTTTSGGSLLVGAGGTAANAPVITTTTDKDANGIYGGRVVFFNGTANTGYDWATNTGGGGPNYTLSAFSSYTALPTSGGVGSVNYNMTASTTLTAGFSANTLKMAPGATSAVILDLGGNTLTVDSGGILFTGTGTLNRIQNGTLTAGAGSGYNLIVHSFNSQFVNSGAGNGINNAGIRATIADNGSNKVALVVEGTPGGTAGMLHLAGTNSFTGGIFLNNAVLNLAPITGVGGTAAALNNNTITVSGYSQIHIGNTTTASPIVLNGGALLDFRLNTNTFNTTGSVTGDGGITLGQAGGGSTSLIFSNTGNSFTGPIQYRVTAQSGNLTVGSLADSATLGEGNITFGATASAAIPHNFTYSATSGSVTLTNRRFELATTTTTQSINNNGSQAFTINSDILSSGTGTKTLTLGGTGAGLSIFAGKITNGTITTLNVTKGGSAVWTLSGDNSFNGTMTLNGASAGSQLNINSATAIGTGTFIISGGNNGKIDNTSGGAITLSTNNAQTWSSDFAFAGSNDLNLGTGAVSLGATRNVTVSAKTLTVGGIISGGTFGIQKLGAGTLALGGGNAYTGATTVAVGTLSIDGTGSINTSSGVTINGGTFRYNSSTNLSAGVTFTSGTVAGTNWNGALAGLSVGTNQTISPGNSPGTAATVAQTWAAGGSYLWEINNATGTAGLDPGWDLENGTGTLNITAVSGSEFNLLVTSLTLLNAAGNAVNFVDSNNYTWLIADFNAITGFASNAFNINTSAFSNPFTGTFGVSLGGVGAVPGDNSQIYLTYTPIPEPRAALLGGLALLALLRRRR